MKKARKIFVILAIVCFGLGLLLVAVGFFAGGGPVSIQNHGYLTEYMARLKTNAGIFSRNLSRAVCAVFPFLL